MFNFQIAYWVFFLSHFCCLLNFLKINFFEKFFQNTNVSNSLYPDQARPIMSGLIRVQTVCETYQHMTLVGKELIMYSYVKLGTFYISVCETMTTHALNSTYLDVNVKTPEMSSAQVQPMGPGAGFLGPAGPGDNDVAPILPPTSNSNYIVDVGFVNVKMNPLPELEGFLLALDGSPKSVTFMGTVDGDEITLVKHYFLNTYPIQLIQHGCFYKCKLCTFIS